MTNSKPTRPCGYTCITWVSVHAAEPYSPQNRSQIIKWLAMTPLDGILIIPRKDICDIFPEKLFSAIFGHLTPMLGWSNFRKCQAFTMIETRRQCMAVGRGGGREWKMRKGLERCSLIFSSRIQLVTQYCPPERERETSPFDNFLKPMIRKRGNENA